MPPQQFEMMKEQLKRLTPQQLRALKGEIISELDTPEEALISDEEAQLISSLFS